MSKERAQRRARREAEAARREDRQAAQLQRASAQRQRTTRARRTWRSVRLWRSGSTARSAAHREQWAVAIAFALIVVIGVWFVTRSVTAVVVLVLVGVLAVPAMLVLSGERRKG